MVNDVLWVVDHLSSFPGLTRTKQTTDVNVVHLYVVLHRGPGWTSGNIHSTPEHPLRALVLVIAEGRFEKLDVMFGRDKVL